MATSPSGRTHVTVTRTALRIARGRRTLSAPLVIVRAALILLDGDGVQSIQWQARPRTKGGAS